MTEGRSSSNRPSSRRHRSRGQSPRRPGNRAGLRPGARRHSAPGRSVRCRGSTPKCSAVLSVAIWMRRERIQALRHGVSDHAVHVAVAQEGLRMRVVSAEDEMAGVQAVGSRPAAGRPRRATRSRSGASRASPGGCAQRRPPAACPRGRPGRPPAAYRGTGGPRSGDA